MVEPNPRVAVRSYVECPLCHYHHFRPLDLPTRDWLESVVDPLFAPAGILQERASLYSVPANVAESAKRFFVQTREDKMNWKPIKLVRDKLAERGLKDPEVKCEPVETEDLGRMLRDKLAEECHEYQEDRTPEELADIIEACFALASHEHGVPPGMLLELVSAKREEKGGFVNGIGLFVKVRAS